FDSLGYAKRLRDGGVPRDQAEVHAEAARDFIMAELATKADLMKTEQRLQTSLVTSITEVQTEIRATKADLLATEQKLQTSLPATDQKPQTSITELQTELRTSVRELDTKIDTQTLRLTVRLGAMQVVLIGALAAILKLA